MSIIFYYNSHFTVAQSAFDIKTTSSNTFKPYIKLCYEPVKITHYPGYLISGSSWTYNFWHFFHFFYIIYLFTFADIYICFKWNISPLVQLDNPNNTDKRIAVVLLSELTSLSLFFNNLSEYICWFFLS